MLIACHDTALSPFGPPVRHWGRAQPYRPQVLGGDAQPSHKFEQLWPVFERQETDSACSLVCATIVVNAMGLGGHHRLSQGQVAALDTSGAWRQATRQNGAGIDLDAFGLHLMQAFFVLGMRHVTVDAVHVEPEAGGDSDATLRVALRDIQTRDDTFVIINANQRLLYDDGDSIGHYVLAAGWDERHQRVLLLDPDRRDVMPFWLPIDALEKAMRTRSEESGMMRGFITIRGGR